ncbi:MAG: PAS domain-containing protein [Rhodobiaceae bacterium]|nr:PAS domain-containing protein [Rhodobiaceae bacterium]MCC0055951.1 PAS domain-containing protein [Rhodobiaceae bacterium]
MSGSNCFTTEQSALRIGSPASRRMFEYWNRLRGREVAPQRSEIEPADISDILPDTFILEQWSADRFRYRLAGTRLCAVSGGELKGAEWLSDWGPADAESLVTAFRTMTRDGAGALLRLMAGNARGQQVRMEIVLLPLLNGEQGISRVIGTASALDNPYWLGSVPLTSRMLTDLHMIWPEESDRIASGAQNVVALSNEPVRWHGHLAVYEGGAR